MPKRKIQENEDHNSSDQLQEGDALSESTIDPPVLISASNSTSSKMETQEKVPDREPPVKKLKVEDDYESSSVCATGATKTNVKVLTNKEGEKYLDLGRKKRAVVRTFKGITLLDVREYYSADGEEKPGKKGISLTLDQWKVLREASSVIDQLFAEKTAS